MAYYFASLNVGDDGYGVQLGKNQELPYNSYEEMEYLLEQNGATDVFISFDSEGDEGVDYISGTKLQKLLDKGSETYVSLDEAHDELVSLNEYVYYMKALSPVQRYVYALNIKQYQLSPSEAAETAKKTTFYTGRDLLKRLINDVRNSEIDEGSDISNALIVLATEILGSTFESVVGDNVLYFFDKYE